MGGCFHPHSTMKAFTSVVALVAAATAAPVANLGLVGGHAGLVGGHAGLVGGHGLVSGPGAFGGPGLVGGHGLVGGVAVAPAVAVGAGQVSHQSVHKPLQGENRGVTQSKAFGSPVAAVADHPSTTH